MKLKKAAIIGISKESLSDKSWQKLNKLIPQTITFEKDNPKIKSSLKEVDSLLVGFGVEVSKKIIDLAPNLKYIGVLATAYGKIDTSHARKKKIIVSSLAGYSTDSVAEFVIAVILEHLRGLEEGKRRGRSNNYSEMGISAFEIKNKNFGIVGLGTIGSRVAEIALGFNANIKYFSRNRKKDFEKRGVKHQSLLDLAKSSDIISINLAQTKETEKILDERFFSSLKSGAVVVNTAPMELVDLKALTKRLGKKDITFILDHSDEMPEKDLALLSKHENCTIYPPMAYISREAGENKERIFISNIENFISGKPTNVVD